MRQKKFDFGDMTPTPVKSDIQLRIEKAQREAAQRRPSNVFRRGTPNGPLSDLDREIARENDIAEKGKKCEDDVWYALTYLPRDRYKVYQNIFVHGRNELGEAEDQEHDFVIVCNSRIFDIEAKSIAGEMLTIYPDGQWEVKSGRRSYAIPNPQAQIERHRKNLQYRMVKSKNNTPITEVLVTNNERLLIRNLCDSSNIAIVKTDNLVEYILGNSQDCGQLGARAALISQGLVSGQRAYRKAAP